MEHEFSSSAEYGLEWRIILPDREVVIRPRPIPAPSTPESEQATVAGDSHPRPAANRPILPRIYANMR
ncbi:MAG: hypothetical protein MUF38_05705 [Anaerolineae bacterium]|jgi:hypothetical protein|nr:hypothetical protein [Anaerolineae bacterium]